MAPHRRALTGVVVVAGVAVLALAAFVLHRPIRERYWLGKLETGETDVRIDAARALGRLRSKRAESLLDDLLDDDTRELRYEARLALWRIDPRKARFPPYFAFELGQRSGMGGTATIDRGSFSVSEYIRFLNKFLGMAIEVDPAARDMDVELSVPLVDADAVSVLAVLEAQGLRIEQQPVPDGDLASRLVVNRSHDAARGKATAIIDELMARDDREFEKWLAAFRSADAATRLQLIPGHLCDRHWAQVFDTLADAFGHPAESDGFPPWFEYIPIRVMPGTGPSLRWVRSPALTGRPSR